MSNQPELPTEPPQGPRHDVAEQGNGSGGNGGTATATRHVSEEAQLEALRADLGPIKPVSLFTLIRVEMRKMFNTRGARGYCLAIALALAAMVAIMFSVDSGNHPYSMYFNATVQFMGFLLPILGIMLVTNEWSQRTAMATFALEPRRGRIITAKVIVTLLLSAGLYAVALGIAAAGHFAAVTFRGATEDWAISGSFLAGVGVWLTAMILMGLAFALLLHSTPMAIVAFFLLPQISTIVFQLVSAFEGIRDWVDMNTAWLPLLEGDGARGLEGEQWSQAAVVFVIWVLVPLTAGIIRTMRREVK